MGAEQGKPDQPAPQAPDMNTAIFQLKMASKRFQRESKKAEKEKEKNMKKIEKCLQKGDEESARLYSQQAQNNVNDAKKYLRMGLRLESISAQIKSNNTMNDIMGVMSKNVNPVLLQQADTLDMRDMMKNFEIFQNNFDKLNVNSNIMSDNFDQMQGSTNTESADQIFNQMKNKVMYNDDTLQTNTPVQQKQQEQNANTNQFDDYLNALKN